MVPRLSPWERRIIGLLLAVITAGVTVVEWITAFSSSIPFWDPWGAFLCPLGAVLFLGMIVFPLPGKQLTPLWWAIFISGLAAGAVNLVLEFICVHLH